MISVCMATYNGEKYIKEQIDSILIQLSDTDEIVISDDGSKDDTLKILSDYKDDRIKIFKHTPVPAYSGHEKASANFANALRYAKGDYIFLSDQDDIWMKDKVTKCMKKLANSDFVYHNAVYFYNDDRPETIRFSNNPIPKKWYYNLKRMSLSGCCFAFNRKCLDLALPFPVKLIGQDYWISTIAIKYLKTSYIDDCLIRHRRYNESVTTNIKNSVWKKISYRIVLLFQLIKRFNKIER